MKVATSVCLAVGAGALLLGGCGTSASTSSSSSPGQGQGWQRIDTVVVPVPPAAQANVPVPTPGPAGGALTIGTVLPVEGSVGTIGRAAQAGADLAVAQINAAGGVNGQPVVMVPGDSGDPSENVAAQTVASQLQQGVNAIIGSASSASTLSIIDAVTQAGVVMVSPASTAVSLSTYPDQGLFFRVSPPDTAQGKVLAGLAKTDGAKTMCIFAEDSAYGTELAASVSENFTAQGGKVNMTATFMPGSVGTSADVQACAQSKPQSIVLISAGTGQELITQLVAADIGPANVDFYVSDGDVSQTFASQLPAGTLNGAKGTVPGAVITEGFRNQLVTASPGLVDLSYAAEGYDAANLIALAAVKAGSSSGAAIAAQLPAVSGAEGAGQQCSDFGSCAALLQAGSAINYSGQSGDVNFSASGDPTVATIGVYRYGTKG